MLGAIDEGAKETFEDAKQQVGAVVSAVTPKKSGLTAATLQPRLRRAGTGWSLTVSPGRSRKHGKATVAQVVRWTSAGTGKLRIGPGPKKPIVSRHKRRRGGRGFMVLPGGRRVVSVEGQHPNPYLAHIRQQGTVAVEHASERGANRAARAAERAA